jgi:hypothetical protein
MLCKDILLGPVYQVVIFLADTFGIVYWWKPILLIILKAASKRSYFSRRSKEFSVWLCLKLMSESQDT